LRPRRAAGPRQLPVTAFRDYLRCPVRFYLTRVLGMEAVDPEKTELDAFDFGNLCHAALEAMGREPALRDCTDGAILRDFLWAELERIVRARHGAELMLPLTVQIESARQRLAHAAEIQARERAEGWVIEEVEWRFPESPSLVFGGLPVRGKIDRLDRHEGTGAWRVLDYKTSDKPVTPRAAHCRSARTGVTPELGRFTLDGRELEWTDLQLPLYLAAVADRNAVGGYFNLPKAVGETGIVLWPDYSPQWQAAAMRCAAAVAGAIQAGRFWPPAEEVPYDDFAVLFHHGAVESIEPEWAAGGRRDAP
jgi:ATP-dependent helicase/nuclease subunit B